MTVHIRRALRSALAFGAIGALALVATAPGAGAGIREEAAPLTIVKSVTSPFPAGTTFTATISCTPSEEEADAAEGIIDDGGDGTDVATVTFGADGQPTSPDTVSFDGPGVCTITETANGGATSTTYACVGTLPEPDDEITPTDGVDAFQEVPIDQPVCPSAGPQSSPITVNIIDPDQTATVTITNTPPAAQVAPQIVAQPAFTG
jgi:hypothetical protein